MPKRLLLGLALLASQPSLSAERDFTLTLSNRLTHHENFFQTQDNKIKETSLETGLNLNGETREQHIDLEASLSTSHLHYVNGETDNRQRSAGVARMSLHTASKRFAWITQHEETPRLLNILEQDLDRNNGQQSVFSTGPSVKLRLGNHNRLNLSHRYTLSRFRNSDADSTSHSSTLDLSRNLNKLTSLTWSANHVESEADDIASSLTHSTESRVNLALNRRFLGATLALRGGLVRVATEFADGQTRPTVDEDEWGANLAFDAYDLSLNVDVSRRLSSNGIGEGRSDQITSQDVDTAPSEDLIGESSFNVLKRQQASISLDTNAIFGRTGFSLLATENRTQSLYLGMNERKTHRYGLTARRSITPTMRVSLSVIKSTATDLTPQRFQDVNGELETLTSQLRYSYISTKRTVVHCQARYEEAEGARFYDDASASCGVVWLLI